ncbi:MAG TPA: MGMT family protein [Pseudomonadales bacterium]|nr:MGMT family protein [Pseudomonadales bacterium]
MGARRGADREEELPDAGDRIRLVVAAIPCGRVATYGQVAEAAGLPGRARLVGRVLSMLPAGSRIPWHRVVAAGGRIAASGSGADEQRRRLRAEGVGFRGVRADLRASGWQTTAV